MDRKHFTETFSPYSFSGVDTRMWTYYEGAEESISLVDSIQTLSYSVHQSKLDVYSMGSIGRSGVTSGFRKYAGSMIMTVLRENPLAPWIRNLKEAMNNGKMTAKPLWSLDESINGTGIGNSWSGSDTLGGVKFFNKIAPALPPSNLIVYCMTEIPSLLSGSSLTVESTPPALGYTFGTRGADEDGPLKLNTEVNPGNFDLNSVSRDYQIAEGSCLLIRGIEFLDEGFVVSVHDTMTEITLSFTADEVKPLSLFGVQVSGAGKELTNQEVQRLVRDADIDPKTEHSNLIASLFG